MCEWLLLYVALCALSQYGILCQYLDRRNDGYHFKQYCKLHVFQKVDIDVMHDHDDKYPAWPESEISISVLIHSRFFVRYWNIINDRLCFWKQNTSTPWDCSLPHIHCQVQIIPPIKLTVCYSSAHHVRVVTISCSSVQEMGCDALVERLNALPVMFETS